MHHTMNTEAPEPIILLVPELAVLAVLDHTVGFAICALTSAHPHLVLAEPRTTTAQAAHKLIERLHACQNAAAQYRQHALRDLLDDSNDDLPF